MQDIKWDRQAFTFCIFTYQQALMSDSPILSCADCGPPYMCFTVSAEPDETGTLIITTAFDTPSDGEKHTTTHNLT